MSDFRQIPSVDTLISSTIAAELIDNYGRAQVLQAIRSVLDELRQNQGINLVQASSIAILSESKSKLRKLFSPTLKPVINATGVILHTNLGRAPLSTESIAAMQSVVSQYNTLEYDLAKGKRGSRSVHAEEILKLLTGAEAATVVNNNASAVLVALSALANRRKVIISRTQLIEIGGGFRIPDVMKQSGAKLIEVGTTNHVHAFDYSNALAAPTSPAALVMRAHHSNFKIIGFTSEPSLREICEIAHSSGVPVLDDLGSGTFLDTATYGLQHEPTISESLIAGADLVTFSGDKLLGGPQAGIIVGRKDLIEKIKKHPLFRAIRPDKLCLAALTATLYHYLRDEAEQKIPIWQMISKPLDEIRVCAQSWSESLQTGEVIESKSTIGGGSLPEETLPTFVLALRVQNTPKFIYDLRELAEPIIARVEANQVLLDPRTVFPFQESAVLLGLKETLSKFPNI